MKTLSDKELGRLTGSYNWPCFASCLLSNGAKEIPELAELVDTVTKKDWVKASDLIKYSDIASLPIVARCLACC